MDPKKFFAELTRRTLRRRTSVTFVKELPKTATGKIQKYLLRGQRLVIAPQ